MQAGERWQGPILVCVMGVFVSAPEMTVVLHPRVNPLLKEFAAILRIARGSGMGFVVDAPAKFFSADKVALVGKTG